jgi:hypothetical protein
VCQIVGAAIGRHADNFHGLFLLPAEPDFLSNRIGARKIAIRQRLVDDGDFGSVTAIAGTKVTTLCNRQSQKFEIARRHGA